MKTYVALIIDIVKSRTYGQIDRSDIQVYINDVIKFLNQVYKNACELEMVFSAGDEIQGLFTNIDTAYLYYRLFKMLVSPVEIRGGIGTGEWTIQVKGEASTAQDGPAYHLARQAITQTDPTLGYQLLVKSNSTDDVLLNSLISAEMTLINGQSLYQNELLLLSEILYPIDTMNNVNQDSLIKITDLIVRKYNLSFYARIYQKRKSNLLITALANLTNYKPQVVSVLDGTPLLYITSGRIRGLATQISKLTGTSHQNAGKALVSGNIAQIRNLAAAALNMMHDNPEDN